MRVTKHHHACLSLEIDGSRLIIDPGGYTPPLQGLEDVVGVVLTHEHADHWTPEHLDRILAAAGPVPIYGPQGVAASAAGYDVIAVTSGDAVTAGPFDLEFFGGLHNVIHSSIPRIQNVGVLVNGVFYYPGDSYAVPDGREVALLAAPVGAPWLKIGEAMDFVLAVAPRCAFGTHDMTLSALGLGMGRERLEWAVQQGGGRFMMLEPGDHTDL